ncbi:Tyrosine recombinase XerC [subsurface metagenome]
MPISTLSEALDYYRKFAAAVLNRSPSTIRGAEVAIGQLLSFLGVDPTLKEIRRENIIDFLSWLRKKPKWEGHPAGNHPTGKLTDVSVNTYFRALRAFFNWLVGEKIIPSSPMEGLPAPTIEDKLPSHISFDQAKKLVRSIDINSPAGARDKAIIIVILDIALRASELISLQLNHVDIENRDLMVTRRKVRRQQLLSFHQATVAALATYILRWRPESEYGELFLTLDGRPLTTDRLAKILYRRGQAAGIHLNPQLLRHTAAILKRRLEGWDAERIQNMLGHSTSHMTRHYIRAAGDDDLREAFRKPGWVDKI